MTLGLGLEGVGWVRGGAVVVVDGRRQTIRGTKVLFQKTRKCVIILP